MSGPLRLSAGTSTPLLHGRGVRTDLTLLEIDGQLFQEIQTHGGVVKGEAHEEAVLCTRSQTFALKHVQTTNAVLLIPPTLVTAVVSPSLLATEAASVLSLLATTQGGEGQVAAVAAVAARADHHLETVLTAPRLERLPEMLPAYQEGDAQQDPMDTGVEAAAMGGGRDDASRDLDGAELRQPSTFGQLLWRLQASEGEVRAALRRAGAIEVGGRWHAVPPELAHHALRVLLLTCAARSWPRSAVPAAAAAAAMEEDDIDPRLTQHCLERFGSVTAGEAADGHPQAEVWPSSAGDETADDDTTCWALDDAMISLHFARHILQQQEVWQLSSFMEAWRNALAECGAEDISVGEAALAGEALVEAEAGSLRAYPKTALPASAPERFTALWAARPLWAAVDLEPYVAGLQVPGQDAKALLLRYARKSQNSKGIFYNCRK